MFIAVPLQLKEARRRTAVPLVNGLLIAANVLAFWLFGCDGMYVGRGTSPFRVITYSFAHANALHLIGNLWVLWVFGNAVNRRLGNGYYLLAYLGSAMTIGLFAWILSPGGLVGASGVIFAVVAIALLLMPAAPIDVGYVALFPVTILIGLIQPPRHWPFWFVRWDRFDLRAVWALLLVPLLELWGLIFGGWNWSNLGHLLGFVCGVGAVLLLPTEITMNRRAVRTA